MKVDSIILIICLITAIGCLGAGYILAGYWLIVPVLLAILLFWVFAEKWSVFWSASSLLLATVLLAAIGITAGISSILMIVACTAALVSWDLIQFNRGMAGASLRKTNTSLERYHLQSLVLAAFAGLMVALISSLINLHLSFFLIIILVLMTMVCLTFSMQYIAKKRQ